MRQAIRTPKDKNIVMVVEPRKTVSWEEFREYPSFSIALDGYCSGKPQCHHSRTVMNMNHHEGVDALATRATCEQALVQVKTGLYEVFQEGGVPTATLYLNDPDQDAALATYVLMHPEHADRPMLRELVSLEDHMDVSAGLYPPARCDIKMLRRLAWIQNPYMAARLDGSLFSMDGDAMHELIATMHHRIRATLFGRGKEIPLDTRFDVLHDYGSWKMIKEIGTQARTGMAEAGIRAYVVLKFQGAPDGYHGTRYDYSVGRLSTVQPFPLRFIYAALNEAEGIDSEDKDKWGGSRVIGGSPRARGSRLTPTQVGQVISACLKTRQIAIVRQGREEKIRARHSDSNAGSGSRE